MHPDEMIRLSTPDDFADWLLLAKEVEPLFGPMADDENFRKGIRQTIDENSALCSRQILPDGNRIFQGGIVFSTGASEILWLAVASQSRGKGIGRALLSEAISRLDHQKPVIVTTFDQTVAAGYPARKLYLALGFKESSPAGVNPAGIPVVVMTLWR